MEHKPKREGDAVIFENSEGGLVLRGSEIFVQTGWDRPFVLETPEQAQRLALELLVGPGGTGTENIDQAVRALRREFILYDEERRKEQEKQELEEEACRLRNVLQTTPGDILTVWAAVAEEARKIAQEKADAEEE